MDITVFEKGLVNWKIELSSKQMEQFLLYYEKMVEKNKVMNLTAITGFEEVVYKHFLDSLSLCPHTVILTSLFVFPYSLYFSHLIFECINILLYIVIY